MIQNLNLTCCIPGVQSQPMITGLISGSRTSRVQFPSFAHPQISINGVRVAIASIESVAENATTILSTCRHHR